MISCPKPNATSSRLKLSLEISLSFNQSLPFHAIYTKAIDKMKTQSSPPKATRFSPYRRSPPSQPKLSEEAPHDAVKEADSADVKRDLDQEYWDDQIDFFNDQNDATLNLPYRLNFGKHSGKLLEECPRDYVDWLIRKDVAASRPDLREAIAQIKPTITTRPPTTPISRHAVTREPSSIQPGVPQSAAQTRGANFVITIGKHTGKKLSEIPTSYLHWLADNPTYKPSPELRTALIDFGISSTSTEPMPLPLNARNWNPPLVQCAPSIFYEGFTKEALWITTGDAKRFFSFSEENLRVVPTLPSDPAYKTRYWLYHVWDLARVSKGLNEAQRGLVEFLNKNRRREQEIWDEMGLDPLCE